MPKSVTIAVVKAKRYDKKKIASAEKRLARKWDKALGEAFDWLDQLDFDDIPDRNYDGDRNHTLEVMYDITTSVRELIQTASGLLSGLY